MGAMLVGMVTGFFAVCFAVTWKIIYMTVTFIDAKRHGMCMLWLVAVLLFDLVSLPFYIYARIKISKNDGSEAFDDKSFVKKFFWVMLVGYLIMIIISVLWTTFIGSI